MHAEKQEATNKYVLLQRFMEMRFGCPSLEMKCLVGKTSDYKGQIQATGNVFAPAGLTRILLTHQLM
jgi:hypothetical protein